MLRSIDLSRAGMLRQQQQMDSVAHNVVNANTPGFKELRAALESGDVPPADGAQAAGADIAAPSLDVRLRSGRLLTQGPLRFTGVMTDMAVDGEGFFAVRLPDGSDAYTRNGGFRMDSGRRLTDTAGNLVQPAITVPAGATDLNVGADGTVTTTVPGGSTQTLGRITLARFDNPNALLAGEDGLYRATSTSGPARLTQPGQGGTGAVRGGMLEDANIDMTAQMTSLVRAQRAYQLNTSAFRMADDLLRMANSLQGNGG